VCALQVHADRTAFSTTFNFEQDENPITPTVSSRRRAPDLPATTPRPGVSEPRPDTSAPRTEPRRKSNFEKACRGAICNPFYKKFKECEPGCEPTNTYTGRPEDPGSCHHQHRAYDFMGFKCDGKLYKPLGVSKAVRDRYFKAVACIRRGIKHTIWQSANHYDHAHFSLGCYVGGSYRW